MLLRVGIGKTFALILLVSIFLFDLESALSKNAEPVELTSYDFDDGISTGRWFVKFYAPWCGHCKKLAPKWAAVAKKMDGKVSFAKVDATQCTDLKKKYEVGGFPSLVFFEDGDKILTYQGPRDEESLETFCHKMSASPLEVIESVEAIKTKLLASSPYRNIEKSPITFILGLDSSATSTSLYDKIEKIAREKRSSHFFLVTKEQDVLKYICETCTTPFLARFEPEEEIMSFPGSLAEASDDSIVSWIDRYSFPHFKNLDGLMFNSMANAKDQLLVLCIFDPRKVKEQDQNTTTYLDLMGKLARPETTTLSKEAQQKFIFAQLDGEKFSAFVEDYYFTQKMLPRTLVLDNVGYLYYQDIDAESDIESYLEKIVKGEAVAYYDGMWKIPFRAYRKFQQYLPWSLLVVGLLLGLLGVLAYLVCWVEYDDFDELEEEEELHEQNQISKGNEKESKKNQ